MRAYARSRTPAGSEQIIRNALRHSKVTLEMQADSVS